jgi:DNA-binding NarL/FixJ family response regulator
MTTVAIVDDHEIARQGVRQVLGQDQRITVVGEAGNSADGIRLIAELEPEVAIIDIRLGGSSGIDLCREIRHLTQGTRALVLTAYDDDRYVAAAVRQGAGGFLLKGVSGQELRQAVLDVAQGKSVFPPTNGGPGPVDDGLPRVSGRGLTAREVEVLRLMAWGYRNREISETLGVSLKTVETHAEHVFRKLGVSNRTQAVVAALREERLANALTAGD